MSDFFQFRFVVMDLCCHFIGYHNLQERKKIILEKSNALAKSVNGRLVVPQNLLNEVYVVFLVIFSTNGSKKGSLPHDTKKLINLWCFPGCKSRRSSCAFNWKVQGIILRTSRGAINYCKLFRN